MKIEIIFLLCAIAFVASSPAGVCHDTARDPYPTYLADTVDCSVFYECNLDKPMKMKCPPETYWDPTKVTCEWYEYVDCGTRSTTPKVPTVPTTKSA